MTKILLPALIILFAVILFSMTSCTLGNLSNKTEKIYELTDSFEGIEIISDTADINIFPSDNGKCKMVSVQHEKTDYSTVVENGMLKIKHVDEKGWFERLFCFGKYSLTIYLPKSEYTSLVINGSTGNITLPDNFKFGSIDMRLSTGDTKLYASADKEVKIHASTGDVTVENVTCDSLEIKVSTGNTYLTNLTVKGDIKTSCSTGNTFLNNVISENIASVGDSGDVAAEKLITKESLSIERSTGKIDIKESDCSGKLALQTSTGKISASALFCTDMTVTVSTGKTNLSNVSCANLSTTGNTGDIDISNLISSGKIDIRRTTGDVNFNRCDAAEIRVTTGTGNVTGSLRTDKIFIPRTSTGKINLPETTTGGICKITTGTGDINISIAP